jgi:DNA-binding MarR family transcriptional regulator
MRKGATQRLFKRGATWSKGCVRDSEEDAEATPGHGDHQDQQDHRESHNFHEYHARRGHHEYHDPHTHHEHHDPHTHHDPHDPHTRHERHEHHTHRGHGAENHPGARGQGRLLKLLLERDGILMKDIVEELDIRPSSASELVAKLEKRGFVRTETDAGDKRAKRVYTTEKTREHSDQLKAAHGEMAAEVLAGLSEQEQEQLLALLRKIARSLEDPRENSQEMRKP